MLANLPLDRRLPADSVESAPSLTWRTFKRIDCRKQHSRDFNSNALRLTEAGTDGGSFHRNTYVNGHCPRALHVDPILDCIQNQPHLFDLAICNALPRCKLAERSDAIGEPVSRLVPVYKDLKRQLCCFRIFLL